MAVFYDMAPASSFRDLQKYLTHAFKTRYPVDEKRKYRMIGVLFARPEHQLAKTSIIPHLEYFHHRSGNHIDFFFAGYDIIPYLSESAEHQIKAKIGKDRWSFSNYQFNELRRRFESLTSWKYSGGVELMLTNSYYDPSEYGAQIDFSSSIICNLDKMVAKQAIDNVEIFFEEIFRFAEKKTDDDPTWGFSDRKGVSVAGSVFRRIVLSLLPKRLGEDLEKIANFAILDLSKSK